MTKSHANEETFLIKKKDLGTSSQWEKERIKKKIKWCETQKLYILKNILRDN